MRTSCEVVPFHSIAAENMARADSPIEWHALAMSCRAESNHTSTVGDTPLTQASNPYTTEGQRKTIV
jgi:hypothetical protein